MQNKNVLNVFNKTDISKLIIFFYIWYKCDWIWEKPPSTHNYKSLEIPILIIWRVVSREGKQVLAWNSPRFYSYLYSTYAPTVEWIASWIARHFR